jgi:predicted alpha/beta-fold hydrolase
MSKIQDFKPSFWFRNHHLQTLITPMIRKPTPLQNSTPWSITRNNITLYGQMHPSKATHKHLIVIFHGLGGHIHSAYITGAASALIEKGFHVLRVSLRGGEDDSEHTYHASQIEDIEWIVDHFHSQGYKVSLMGFSLSASMILKWLEHERNIQAALLISPPLNLEACVKRLDHPNNKMYQKYFLNKLRQLLEKKNAKHPHAFAQYIAPETFSSIRSFDSNFTAKKNGFTSAEAYYLASSPTRFDKIRNNVCIIHSKDDPFIGHEELLRLQNMNLPNVQVHLTNFGGHVGFYQGPGKGFMIDPWAAEYFEETLLAK